MNDNAKNIQVNVGLFEQQHAELSMGLHLFNEELAENASKERLLEIMDDLIKKTQVHFSSEEEVMLEFAFDGYNEHKKIHDEFLRMLHACRRDYAEELRYVNLEYLVVDINHWIVYHISNYDKMYMEYFESI